MQGPAYDHTISTSGRAGALLHGFLLLVLTTLSHLVFIQLEEI